MTDAAPATPAPLTEDQRLAMADEQQAAQEAAMAHLQSRVITLNLEVRLRDGRLAELEAELAERDRAEPSPEPVVPED